MGTGCQLPGNVSPSPSACQSRPKSCGLTSRRCPHSLKKYSFWRAGSEPALVLPPAGSLPGSPSSLDQAPPSLPAALAFSGHSSHSWDTAQGGYVCCWGTAHAIHDGAGRSSKLGIMRKVPSSIQELKACVQLLPLILFLQRPLCFLRVCLPLSTLNLPGVMLGLRSGENKVSNCLSMGGAQVPTSLSAACNPRPTRGGIGTVLREWKETPCRS